MLYYSKFNWQLTVAQFGVAVSEVRSAGMQRIQAQMHTKLCLCAARAYSKSLVIQWYSKVNWQLIVAQLGVAVSEAR